MTDDVTLPVGERIKLHRERAGMSRPVLAGLLGRSAEWLKAVESGRIQTPRLEMLLRIAQVLELDDLAELTGNGRAVPVTVYAGQRHAALSAVQSALTGYRISLTPEPVSVTHLAERLHTAWQVRHSSPDHRTQLGSLLPGLIRDAQMAVRSLSGPERREARRVLSGVYQLADFYVAYQPSPELVWMVADRALTEAQEADDPYAIAGGAWAMVQALRDAGRWDEAVSLATDAQRQLLPHLDEAPADWRGMVGALDAEIAYVHARRGRHGEAWAHWEAAERIANGLGAAYRHTQSSFSQSVMRAHAVTLGVELRRIGEARRAAETLDPLKIPSLARRSRHLIEVARVHALDDDRAAVLATLDQAQRVAPETISYNGFARDMLIDLSKRPPAGKRAAVADLNSRVGLVA